MTDANRKTSPPAVSAPGALRLPSAERSVLRSPFRSRSLAALVLLVLALGACEYRPLAKHEAQGEEHGTPAGESTDEPIPGLGPTNEAPATAGDLSIRTLAGSGQRESVDGEGTKASFVQPIGLAYAPDDTLVVADAAANKIKRVTTDGVVTTIAGSTQGYADGPGAQAKFQGPRGLAVAADGTIYVADSGNHVIRAISPAGQVTTVAGSPGDPGFKNAPGKSAKFMNPVGVAVDAQGTIFVTEFEGHRIRVVSKSGLVRTFAGTGGAGPLDGPALKATFNTPIGIAVDSKGVVYVADAGNGRIRRIAKGTVTTLAGSTQGFSDGVGDKAKFNIPFGVAVDKSGYAWVTDFANHALRRVDSKGGVRTYSAPKRPKGSPSPGLAPVDTSSLVLPAGVVWTPRGIYVADSGNVRIRILK